MTTSTTSSRRLLLFHTTLTTILIFLLTSSTLPTQVQAQSCTFACTSFFGKALFCQNVNHFDIPTTIPTIGADPVLDSCLCTQSVIPALQSCASCRAKNNITIGDATWPFINACNQQFPTRQLWLPPGNAAAGRMVGVEGGLKGLMVGVMMVLVMVSLGSAVLAG